MKATAEKQKEAGFGVNIFLKQIFFFRVGNRDYEDFLGLYLYKVIE